MSENGYQPQRTRRTTTATPTAGPKQNEIDDLLQDEGLLGALWRVKRWTRPALDALDVGWDGSRVVVRGESFTVRYAPDPIRGDGPKTKADAGSKRELWPRPEEFDGDEVWIVEGEPDAVSGRSAGLPCVAVPGANGWRSEYAQRLARFRRVVVSADCDDEGRALRERICTDLAPIADEVIPLELAAKRTDGWDLEDALAADVETPEELRAAGDELHRMAAAAEPFSLPPADDQTLESTTKGSSDPNVLDLLVDMDDALARADEPLPYVIDPFVVRGFVTLLVGRHSSFKSFLMMLLSARCHGGGGELAGLRCEPITALYVDAENGARLMGRRFKDAQIPPDGLLVADGSQLRLPRQIGVLRELTKATGAELVVLDSLRRLTPGLRESDSDDMAPAMAEIARLARELDVAIVLIHHQSSKTGAAVQRGSSAIEDQADAVFRLRRSPNSGRVKLWVGSQGKFRMDKEPDPIWLDLRSLGGVFAIGQGEPMDDDPEEDDDAGPSADLICANRIEALADQVRQDDGWAPKRLAAAAGEKPNSGTFQRALARLYEAGTWEAIGTSRTRRIRPVDGAQQELGTDE